MKVEIENVNDGHLQIGLFIAMFTKVGNAGSKPVQNTAGEASRTKEKEEDGKAHGLPPTWV